MTDEKTPTVGELLLDLRTNLHAIDALAAGIGEAVNGLASPDRDQRRRFGMIDNFAELIEEKGTQAHGLLDDLEEGLRP